MRQALRTIPARARRFAPSLDERGSSLLPVVMMSSLVTMAMFTSTLHFDAMMRQQSVDRAVASRNAIGSNILTQLQARAVVQNSAQLIAQDLNSDWVPENLRKWVRRCLLNDPGVSPVYQSCPEIGAHGAMPPQTLGFPIASLIPGEPPLSGRWVDDGSPEGRIESPVYYRADGSRCITQDERNRDLWSATQASEVRISNPSVCPIVVGTRLEVSCSADFNGVQANCSTVNAAPSPAYSQIRLLYTIRHNGSATNGAIALNNALANRGGTLAPLTYCQAFPFPVTISGAGFTCP